MGLGGPPACTHDMRAARELVLPALYPYAARGLPVLTVKGCVGVGVHAPIKQRPDCQLHIDNLCYDELITALRAPTERGHARSAAGALDRVTVCPQRITAIAAAGLVLTSLDRGTR